jgi:hypothetical protein
MTPIPKPITHVDKKYREWMRLEPCDYCGRTWVDVCLAHRSGGGMGKKDHDKCGIALCHECHKMEHTGSSTFRDMLLIKTGKTWEQHAEKHWEKYQAETGRGE